jgi:hypothetical protein
MKFDGLIKVGKSLGGILQKNSSTILTGFAVAGILTTVVLAVKATPSALDDISVAELHSDIPLTKKRIIAVSWKRYIPTAAVGTATIACIIGANAVGLRRNAALAGLYSLTETAFKEYQTKVVETIGRNKETNVRDNIDLDHITNNPVSKNEIIFTGKGEVLCYDSLSGRYFKSDIEKIRRSINKLNRDLLSENFMSLNELYSELGLSNIALGYDIGWTVDHGLIKVSFSSQLTEEDTPCLVLNYEVVPKYT